MDNIQQIYQLSIVVVKPAKIKIIIIAIIIGFYINFFSSICAAYTKLSMALSTHWQAVLTNKEHSSQNIPQLCNTTRDYRLQQSHKHRAVFVWSRDMPSKSKALPYVEALLEYKISIMAIRINQL